MDYKVNKINDIDINVVDDAWNSVEAGVLVSNDDGSKASLKTEFKLAYDDNGDLYFLYDIDDANPRVTMSDYNAPIYEEETVEFFFATERNLKNYLELEWNAIDGVFAANIDNDLEGHTTIHFIEKNPITSNVIKRAGGYYIVGKIDRSAFKGPMDKWLFNAYRIKRREDDSMILFAYSPTFVEQFHKPNYFVELEFVK